MTSWTLTLCPLHPTPHFKALIRACVWLNLLSIFVANNLFLPFCLSHSTLLLSLSLSLSCLRCKTNLLQLSSTYHGVFKWSILQVKYCFIILLASQSNKNVSELCGNILVGVLADQIAIAVAPWWPWRWLLSPGVLVALVEWISTWFKLNVEFTVGCKWNISSNAERISSWPW